jgi:hypothetical protein
VSQVEPHLVDEVLNKVGTLLKENPELRLTQLLMNVVNPSCIQNFYATEDSALLTKISDYQTKHEVQ